MQLAQYCNKKERTMSFVISDYLNIQGTDNKSVEQVESAVNTLAAIPEIQEKLAAAYALHQEPLTIIVDNTIHATGYGNVNGDHVIYANPEASSKTRLVTQEGEKIFTTLVPHFH